ncbi:hypothetical protein LshimejAT787_0602630 [Lyophyllum shimeji]|uniref:Uncharacterized protein n=1 Tax=Lyophyllum shimeji TaxID=47721 RepID=A0A9P3UQD1_LYOSH|nr:hypothetical protein LshimejAT787_0602630 [Lyophyllum shimeji]
MTTTTDFLSHINMTTGSTPEYLKRSQQFLHPMEPEARRSDYIVPDAMREEFREIRRVLQNNLHCINFETKRVQSLLKDLLLQPSSQKFDVAVIFGIEIVARVFVEAICSSKDAMRDR